MDIDVRQAVPDDFLAIADLDRRAWRDSAHGATIPDGEHTWRIWIDHALTWVACRDDQVVAAIVAFACGDGRYCLHKVMVDQAARGCGVGTRLFEAALAAIDAIGVDVFLTVDPANAAAIRLYERWGFDEKTFHKSYYRADEDRYVMVRRSRKT